MPCRRLRCSRHMPVPMTRTPVKDESFFPPRAWFLLRFVPIILALALARLIRYIAVQRKTHPATWPGFAPAMTAVFLIPGPGGSQARVGIQERAPGSGGASN